MLQQQQQQQQKKKKNGQSQGNNAIAMQRATSPAAKEPHKKR
jgi:hypothetical protein